MILNTNSTFLLADDHSIVRQGLIFIIQEIFKDANILEAKTLKETVQKIEENEVNFLILDLNFPEGNSLNLIESLKENSPNIKILVFTAHDEEIYAQRTIKAGANGYLSKLCSEEELVVALTQFVQNGVYLSEKVRSILFKNEKNHLQNPLDKLTNKEIEIAFLMVKGNGNLEICNLLNLKKSTISTFKTRIFEKLSISNLPQLIEIFNEFYKDK